MFDIVGFYFSVLGNILGNIWGSFQIFPGVNYLVFVLAVNLFCLFISLLKLRLDDTFLSYRQVNKEESRNQIRASRKVSKKV